MTEQAQGTAAAPTTTEAPATPPPAAPEAPPAAAATPPAAPAAPPAEVASPDAAKAEMLLREQRKLDAARKAFADKDKRLVELEALVERAKKDPLAALTEFGHDYTKATDAVAAKAKAANPEAELRAKQEALAREFEAYKAQMEQQKAAVAVDAARAQIVAKMGAEPDRFDMLGNYFSDVDFDDDDEEYTAERLDGSARDAAVAAVFAEIQRHYEKFGKDPTIEEAMDRVEARLRKHALPRLQRAKAFASRATATPTGTEATKGAANQANASGREQGSGPPTLRSGDLTAPTQPKTNGKWDREDAVRRAAALLRTGDET